MNNFILVDFMNMFWRSRHAVRGDNDLKLGMSFHITFNSIKKCWQDFSGTHVIMCLEGRSWRKDFYKPYKANRKIANDQLSEEEQAENQVFFDAYNDFIEFLKTHTNCTVLQHPELEADDLIAGWINNHPHDNHIIVSSDSDFVQLIKPNVSQYNGITDQLITINGYFDSKGKPIKDKKTKAIKEPPDPEWLLFEKIIRGDSSDNVFSAYPGARTKGTKNKIGLLEAFSDRNAKGYNWNNFQLQKWVDHNGVEHRVIDDYERNRRLIDLNYQPDEIKAIINQTVKNAAITKQNRQVGTKLLKFCAKYDLKKITEYIEFYARAFQEPYQISSNTINS